MEKKFEDEELDKLIEEQFIKEAKIMEEALFSDDDSEEYQPSDEEIKASYQKLVERLKADGIYREDDSDEDDEEEEDELDELDAADEIERLADVPENGDKVVPISKKKNGMLGSRFVKVAGIVLVSGMCVFAASMSSEANRNYFVKSIRLLNGDDTRVVIDNDESNENVNTDEYRARDDIQMQLDIELPRFMYRPRNFEFKSYEVEPYAKIARIEYWYNDTIVELGMDREDETSSSKLDSLHGDELEKIHIDSEDIDVAIRKIQDKQDKNPSFLAQWEHNSVVYYILGKIDIEEFTKMIKQIRY